MPNGKTAAGKNLYTKPDTKYRATAPANPPTPIIKALEFANSIYTLPTAVRITPGLNHWKIFEKLCRVTKASGNLIPDVFLAALAIEHGCEWISTDKDYKKFPNLKLRNPLD